MRHQLEDLSTFAYEITELEARWLPKFSMAALKGAYLHFIFRKIGVGCLSRLNQRQFRNLTESIVKLCYIELRRPGPLY